MGSPTKWGHWGPDDEVGALNYLTPGEVQAGLATVRDGRVFTLGAPLAAPGGDPVFPGPLGAAPFRRGGQSGVPRRPLAPAAGRPGIRR